MNIHHIFSPSPPSSLSLPTSCQNRAYESFSNIKAQDGGNLPSVPDIRSTDSREQPSIELAEQATYQDSDTVMIKNETTPTSNIIPDEKQVDVANDEKQSAYQGPATIQHVRAPTADLYTVPAKKQALRYIHIHITYTLTYT